MYSHLDAFIQGLTLTALLFYLGGLSLDRGESTAMGIDLVSNGTAISFVYTWHKPIALIISNCLIQWVHGDVYGVECSRKDQQLGEANQECQGTRKKIVLKIRIY